MNNIALGLWLFKETVCFRYYVVMFGAAFILVTPVRRTTVIFGTLEMVILNEYSSIHVFCGIYASSKRRKKSNTSKFGVA